MSSSIKSSSYENSRDGSSRAAATIFARAASSCLALHIRNSSSFFLVRAQGVWKKALPSSRAFSALDMFLSASTFSGLLAALCMASNLSRSSCSRSSRAERASSKAAVISLRTRVMFFSNSPNRSAAEVPFLMAVRLFSSALIVLRRPRVAFFGLMAARSTRGHLLWSPALHSAQHIMTCRGQ